MLTQQREFLKWIFGVILTAALLLGVVWMTESHPEGSRANAMKEAILRGGSRAPASVPGGHGKGGGSLNISLSPVENVSGALTLKAHVNAKNDLSNLKFEWVLPAGMRITSGSVAGDLGALSAGQSAEFETVFAISPDTNEQIHLQVYRLIDGEKLGEVAQYNSLHQKWIDQKIMSKREALAAREADGFQKPRLVR